MAKQIILTPLAIKNYNQIIEYLLEHWGVGVTENFIKRVEEVEQLLSKQAQVYPFIHPSKKIQRCILTKHNTIYFREYEESIRILMIFDNRQDPSKLRDLL